MGTINEAIKYFLILIEVGGGLRLAGLLIECIADPDTKDGNKKRIRNVDLYDHRSHNYSFKKYHRKILSIER